ncbi:cytochrome-c peroxidase [Vibrio coralliilyticus]|uniref:cytochrome-c peroxidase n=1 Tax=Vibrio coralliilyticus TaxID=190893 RepID=UPI001F5BAC58|nr:cytochrome c peroxidase [Vibrio coralliilyticus]
MKQFVFCLLMLFSSTFGIGLFLNYSYEVTSDSLTPSEKELLKRTILDVKYRYRGKEKEKLPLQVNLGKQLFHDQGLSRNKNISCSSCHVPEHNFQDVNNLSEQVNGSPIRALSLRGVAEQDWYFWDGRADSLWAQALDALVKDHDLSTKEVVKYVCDTYELQYASLLSHCGKTKYSEQQAVEVGKAIGSYVSTITHYWTRFDEYVYRRFIEAEESVDVLTNDELAGMRLFFNSEKTGCIDCHSGPRFTNGDFFAIGTGRKEQHDRIAGGKKYQDSIYQCQNWQEPEYCDHAQYARFEGSDLKGAFKVPSLRNLAGSPSFMHDGRFKSLEEVIDFYINPYEYPLIHTDVTPLRLLPHQREQLILFLQALNDEYIPPSNSK